MSTGGKDYRDPPPAPLLDMEELKQWSFYRALIAEFVATFLFLYIGVGTVVGYKGVHNNLCDGAGYLGVAWAFGGMIFVLVYCTAGISEILANKFSTTSKLKENKIIASGAIWKCSQAVCNIAPTIQ